jgi:hypothetical protein
MANLFNIFIIFALILHFCFAIWIYGNPGLFTNSDSFITFLGDYINQILNTNTGNNFLQDILSRITLPHNLLCLIFLGLIILIFIFRISLYWLFEYFCYRKNSTNIEKKNLEIALGKYYIYYFFSPTYEIFIQKL